MIEVLDKQELQISVLREIEENISFTTDESLASLVNWSGNDTSPIHRWFKYREGYSPLLIEKLQLGHSILDPFCGCGSILVGSAQMGHQSVGIDVNPLATFIAKTKLSPLNEQAIAKVRSFLDSFPQNLTNVVPWDVPQLSIARKVFEPNILNSLLLIRAAIESIMLESQSARDFLFLGWLSILEEVGSFFKEGNGIKYRNKKRTKSGYVKRVDGDWQRERFGDNQAQFVTQAFRLQLETMLEDTIFWQNGQWTSQEVLNGSAIEMEYLLGDKQFDSIVFSPPYANRFDYFESQKVELWFGNFVSSSEELKRLRHKSMRSHLGADRAKELLTNTYIENLISLMDNTSSSWRMGVPQMLHGYFTDMYEILRSCRQYLRPGGKCCIVVGNSAFAGVVIPTDSLTAKIGIEAGFTNSEVVQVRHLTVAPQQRKQLEGLESYMRESVVILS
jgi:site-specific DNA-methyltransferase (adenine-specific)